MNRLFETAADGIAVSHDVRQVPYDPDRPFRATRAAIRRWVADGDWVLLFNAITLASGRVQSE